MSVHLSSVDKGDSPAKGKVETVSRRAQAPQARPQVQQQSNVAPGKLTPPVRKPPPALLPTKFSSPDTPSLQAASPTPSANSQGITPVSRSNSPAQTLRDMVYGAANGIVNNNGIDFTAVSRRDEGEGILDQPVTTPTARTPTRVAPSTFTPPRSPAGPHPPSSPCSRQVLSSECAGNNATSSLVAADGFGIYPPMPDGFDSPCTLPSLVTIRQLDIPPPSKCLIEHKERAVVGGTLENRVCRNMVLTNVELRNSHVTNCVLTDCVIKGGYHSGCRYVNCDIINAHCVVSCVLDLTFTTLCILTNCLFHQGGVKESRVMDCSMMQVGVFYCRLTRCQLRQCDYSDIEQLECPFTECTSQGDINQYFEPPKKSQHASRNSTAIDKNRCEHHQQQQQPARDSKPETVHQGSKTDAPTFNEFFSQEKKVGRKKGGLISCLYC